MNSIDNYLTSLITDGVSDLHFKAGSPPLRRIHGVLYPIETRAMQQQDTENLAMHILSEPLWKRFMLEYEIDSSYSISDYVRFRVSVFKQRGTISVVMRIIPCKIPTLEELNVPASVKNIAMIEHGLVLVTGVTGSGKTSTLAGIINHINTNKSCHIITIEDPIEFLHPDQRAVVNQREIGTDTGSFARAFRAALRQDPDIIQVGELRDLETMEIALQAAETGHLVLSTIHTTDSKETIGRFIDVFPPHQQRQVRYQLASNLAAVISQRLIEKADKQGRILAAEIMIVNAAIRELILDPEKSSDINAMIAGGREQYGMQTFDQALLNLLDQQLITAEEAIKNASSPNDMKVTLRLR